MRSHSRSYVVDDQSEDDTSEVARRVAAAARGEVVVLARRAAAAGLDGQGLGPAARHRARRDLERSARSISC